MEYFDKNFYAYTCQHYLSNVMHDSLFWWDEALPSISWNLGSVSENAHNSWTPWYIDFKFCILMYFNIVQPLPCKMWRDFTEHHFGRRALLVKMLVTLEPCGIFASNFVYLCILTLSSHCHAVRWRGFVEHHFGRSSSFSENAHNIWTLWFIHFKFCIHM